MIKTIANTELLLSGKRRYSRVIGSQIASYSNQGDLGMAYKSLNIHESYEDIFIWEI